MKQIDWKSVGLFCATALPLAALGAFSFSVLPKVIVTRCIGGVLIVFVFNKVMSIKKNILLTRIKRCLKKR